MADAEARDIPSLDRLDRALAIFLRQELGAPVVTMRSMIRVVSETSPGNDSPWTRLSPSNSSEIMTLGIIDMWEKQK